MPSVLGLHGREAEGPIRVYKTAYGPEHEGIVTDVVTGQRVRVAATLDQAAYDRTAELHRVVTRSGVVRWFYDDEMVRELVDHPER